MSDSHDIQAASHAPPAGRRAAAAAGEPLVTAARVDLPGLTEIHLAARPAPGVAGFADQIASAYDALIGALAAHDAGPADVVAERLFLSDIAAQAADAEAAGRRAWAAAGERRPASTRLGQPPARRDQAIEIQALAAVAGPGGRPAVRAVPGLPAGIGGALLENGGVRRLYIAGVTGGPDEGRGFRAESDRMFARALDCLKTQRLTFAQVARTWIFLADIDRDYADLNRARRDFFAAHGVRPAPASTGIQGAPWPADRRCSLDAVAFDGPGVVAIGPIHAPTMNEAPDYGSDFSRGMRVDLGRRALLYISGTASIDEAGRVLHPGDPAGQARRMLLNVEQLLAGQGAGLDRLVTAVTYVKRAADRGAVLDACRDAGFPQAIPHTICVADVCRPEWLCEMEAIAVVG